MPDDFSKTINSVVDVYAEKSGREVEAAKRIEGKRVERQKPVGEEDRRGRGQKFPSEMAFPSPETWDVLLEAVEHFNSCREVLHSHHSQYTIRLWAHSGGLRVQLLEKETGTLVKQTRLIPFKDITPRILEEMIDALIRERGVVIDLLR